MVTVVEIRGDHMLIPFGPGNSVYVHTFAGARVGDRAICHRNSMQVTETIRDPFPTGEILSVVRVEGDVIEGERLGVPCVFRGQGRKVLQGERVVLDASATFVIGSLGMPHSNYARAPKVSVSWDDIGGQDEAKDALREAIELPLSHPKLFAAYGKRASKGVLLAGPPGTGKSRCAMAAATSIAKAHGEDVTSGFIYVKGPELLAKWVGQSEEAVRNLFTAARKHFAEHGYPRSCSSTSATRCLARGRTAASTRSGPRWCRSSWPRWTASMRPAPSSSSRRTDRTCSIRRSRARAGSIADHAPAADAARARADRGDPSSEQASC